MKLYLYLFTVVCILSCKDQSDYKYIIDFPIEYDASKSYPLTIFLHGAGERGKDIEKVKAHGPPKMAAEGYNFPSIIVSPLCPSKQFWEVPRLEAMLADVKSKHQIDDSRIYLTGLSMGGYGTMSWAYDHPEHFAALAPICGGVLDEEKIAGIKNIPIWAFHGAKDSVVPIEQTEEYIDALENIGGKPKYTVYSGADHDSWSRTYANPEFFEWLFAQKK